MEFKENQNETECMQVTASIQVHELLISDSSSDILAWMYTHFITKIGFNMCFKRASDEASVS